MSIQLRPYDNEKALEGAKLMTRDFREVEFIEYNPKLQEGVRVRVQVQGLSAPTTYFVSGRRVLERETKLDLFIAIQEAETRRKAKKAAPVAEARTPVEIAQAIGLTESEILVLKEALKVAKNTEFGAVHAREIASAGRKMSRALRRTK